MIREKEGERDIYRESDTERGKEREREREKEGIRIRDQTLTSSLRRSASDKQGEYFFNPFPKSMTTIISILTCSSGLYNIIYMYK